MCILLKWLVYYVTKKLGSLKVLFGTLSVVKKLIQLKKKKELVLLPIVD